MREVRRYDLPAAKEFSLTLPIGSRILTAQLVGSVVAMWVLVHPDFVPVPRAFIWLATGEAYAPDSAPGWIATIQQGGTERHLFLKSAAE